MNDGLTDKDRSGIRLALQACPKVQRAILFGSRAMGTFRGSSDVDLALEGDDLGLSDLVRIKTKIAEANIPIEVDLVIRDKIKNPDLEKHIQQFGENWYINRNLQSSFLANNWRESTWGEEISLEYGKALRTYDVETGEYRVYGSNGPIGWTDQPLVRGPGVILGRKGAYRGIEFSRKPFFVIDTAYYVVPKTDLDMRWIYYAIKHHKLGEIDDGSPIPSTTRSAVYVKDLNVPPLPEQKAIAKILGDLDDKIELNRRMNATLEAMARALFQSWFVDFDPVRAKLDGRQPPGLAPATAATFPDSFYETELGHIPHGWEVKTLGEVIELAYGKPLKAEYRKNGPVCVYGANGPVGWHNEKLVSGPGIVVGRKGNPGVVTWTHGDFYPIDTTFYVEPIGGCRSLYFLFYALSLHNLANLSADSAVPGLNRNHVYMSKQVIPSQPVLTAFDSQITPIFSTIYANKEQSLSLGMLRDTLLPKLLSGELSVPLPPSAE